MNTHEPFPGLSGEVGDLLEGNGRRLEAIEAVVGSSTFAVVTWRVDYGDWPTFRVPPGVVKLSREEHAITASPHLRLGSSRYYREHEDATDGIRDLEEGRLVQRGALSRFCKKNGIRAQEGFDSVSSTVTWARSDFLMFCTSVAPEGPGLGGLWKQFPEYDSATFIPDPSAFAMQLGKDIGKQFDMNNVRLTSFDTIRQMALAQAEITTQGRLLRKGLDTIVLVSHGPVTYCDRSERVINRFPIARRGEVIPFVKRRTYGGQREYRFVVEVIGEPKETEFLMEVTDELRNLAGVTWKKRRAGSGEPKLAGKENHAG